MNNSMEKIEKKIVKRGYKPVKILANICTEDECITAYTAIYVAYGAKMQGYLITVNYREEYDQYEEEEFIPEDSINIAAIEPLNEYCLELKF